MQELENLRRIIGLVANAGDDMSFRELIESDREGFSGLKMAYATKAFDTQILEVSLAEVEKRCPLVKSLFDGSGLLFYSDEVYKATLAGKAEIYSDFTISFDKNIAEEVRRFVAGKQCSKPDELYKLLLLTRGSVKNGFNYDFLSYLVEEYEQFLQTHNDRPFNTLLALKTLDYLQPDALENFPGKPNTRVSADVIAQDAYNTLNSIVFTEDMKYLQLKYKAMYAILLKAMLNKWKDIGSPFDRLIETCKFSLEIIGKFSKMELYFAWKLLGGDGVKHAFFDPVSTPKKKSLAAMRGIAWDLSMFRMSETMAGFNRKIEGRRPDFFVPFLASLDGKFHKMLDACPLKAIIVSPKLQSINCIFRDEMMFQEAINEDTNILRDIVGDSALQRRRMSAGINPEIIHRSITELEAEVMALTT